MTAPTTRQPQQRDQQPQAIQRAPTRPALAKQLSALIAEKQPSFAQVATKYLTAERLVKLGQLAIARQPDLAKCTVASVLDCLMDCSRLGLEPHQPGGVWLVPFRTDGALVCTKIIDYRGMVDVARRSGELAALHAGLRCERDFWEYWIDASAPSLIHLVHRPAEGDVDGGLSGEADPESAEGRGRIVGAYAVAKLRNGQCHAEYLTLGQINQYRARSRAAKSEKSPWNTDTNAMRVKTVVRRLVNLLPKTPQVQLLREQLATEVDDEDNMAFRQDRQELATSRVRRAAAAIAPGEPAPGDDLLNDVQDDLPFESQEEEKEQPERGDGP